MSRLLRLTFSVSIGLALVSTPAFAQRRGGAPIHHGHAVFIGGYFYDPFFGPYPWWSPEVYPGYYPTYYDESIGVRIEVKPKDAAVYVDGYYAGTVDDFNGFFQRLRLSPGEHDLTVYLEGYRTVHQHLKLSPRSSYKAAYALERLPDGEASEKPPVASSVPPPPPGTFALPRSPARGPQGRPGQPSEPPGAPPASPMPPVASRGTVGTLVVRVQPRGADVLIDGERWTSSDDERLAVEVSPGLHHVEIRKSGYRSLATDVDVRGGTNTPLNVSLNPE